MSMWHTTAIQFRGRYLRTKFHDRAGLIWLGF